ncbi:hypothetical protein BV25DRAFT_697519 [Artomyces pyxidatus]|uniref:Uncharacterized protein n=1 Tax=Artomyces pyxidatus TaxID=48021 RepID=A0ACB8T0X3_9AGAM|nr:hypothetical protein BV25DRAFT_697519 [Artomyces pyxidatus]
MSESPPKPAFLRFIDPEARREYEAQLPTPEELEYINEHVQAQCDNFEECGVTLTRPELKVCSRCKDARYCSPTCQKSHWRRLHKKACIPPEAATSKDIALRLAKQALLVPVVVDNLHVIAVTVLDLLRDITAAQNTAVHVICGVGPADLTAHMRYLITHGERDPNAQVCFSITATSAVRFADMPPRIRAISLDGRAKITRMYAETAQPASPMITFWFSTEDGGGDSNTFAATLPLPLEALAWMKSNPRNVVTRRSAMYGDQEVERTEPVLRECFNSLIRQDTDNRMQLRARLNRTSGN